MSARPVNGNSALPAGYEAAQEEIEELLAEARQRLDRIRQATLPAPEIAQRNAGWFQKIVSRVNRRKEARR